MADSNKAAADDDSIIRHSQLDWLLKKIVSTMPSFSLQFFFNIVCEFIELIQTEFIHPNSRMNKGTRIADHCIRVIYDSPTGKIERIFILEYQDRYDETLPDRLFDVFYNVRSCLTTRNISPFVLFLGKTHSPIRLNEDCDAFDLNFSARSYKISEINEQDLINNPKPFSLIILALYYRLKTSEWKLSNKINTRRAYFEQLILSAYTKVTDEDDLLLFIYCINCILELPQSDQVNIINTVLERFNVSYTTKEYEKLAKIYFLPGYTERMKAEGKAEGIAEGKAEGIAEGEAKTLAQTVYNFDDHKEKFSDEFISEVTGLSIKEILEFRARRPPKN